MLRSRGRLFWTELLLGLAPAVLFVAPRLARWAFLFAYGVRMRLAAGSASVGAAVHDAARSIYYLAWALSGLVAVAALAAAVLVERRRLLARPWLRALVVAGLFGGVVALAQFLAHPLAGLSPRRDALVVLVLSGPTLVTLRHLVLLLRGAD